MCHEDFPCCGCDFMVKEYNEEEYHDFDSFYDDIPMNEAEAESPLGFGTDVDTPLGEEYGGE